MITTAAKAVAPWAAVAVIWSLPLTAAAVIVPAVIVAWVIAYLAVQGHNPRVRVHLHRSHR